MASPLNNPWISGSLGVGILIYFAVAFTPEAWKRPVRDFFTGELRQEGGKEPEVKVGTEKLFRAAVGGEPSGLAARMGEDQASRQRNLFREISKGVKEKPKGAAVLPEIPEGSGLLAVWMEGDTRVAVMTDGMVREGEMWGQFTVERITPEAVTLRHEAGERVVRLGDIRAKAGGPVVAASAPKDVKAPAGSAEAQLQKLIETQKSLDPSKLLQGFPQKILDSLMGTPPKPASP